MATKKTTKKRKVLRKATGKMKTPRVGGRFGALAAAGALGYSLYSKMAGKGSDKTPQKAMSFEEAKRAGVGPIRPKRKVVRKAKVQTIRPKRAAKKKTKRRVIRKQGWLSKDLVTRKGVQNIMSGAAGIMSGVKGKQLGESRVRDVTHGRSKAVIDRGSVV